MKSEKPGMTQKDSIASLIDHALLHPTLTDQEIREGCETARRLGVASVCVKPYAVPMAVEILAGSSVAVGTVIGFPHGSAATEAKVQEAEIACQQGARELDMVINIGKARQGDWSFVERDIQAVVTAGHRHGALVKVIFENDYLPDDATKIKLCETCDRVGADYIKTSTGFGFNKQPSGDYNYLGATPDDVRLMVDHAGERMLVKAAGGIRDYRDAQRMRELGATRLGASASESIVAGERNEQQASAQEGY
jgi:deoxyribose-phosphate aldolase